MLVFSTNVHAVNETKKLLSFHFETKDMGEADVILEIKIRETNIRFPCVSLITLRKC